MKILITGSAGHLGEAMMRTLKTDPKDAVGLDIKPSPHTTHVGTIADRDFVARSMDGIDVVIHAATLHKPHVATHTHQDFLDVNMTGTLNLLEEAVANKVKAFIFTSTTSTFGRALVPPPGEPAAWITETVVPVPKNIYGVTKVAAENLCELFHRKHGLPCLILRTSRFFPEEDDSPAVRQAYSGDNAKVNEFLYRRVDVEDIVTAHLLAIERAPAIGFDRFIISATTPFEPSDLVALRQDLPAVVARHFPNYVAEYERQGWQMFPKLDRVYVNAHARELLGWRPAYDFGHLLEQLVAGSGWGSALARKIGSKGYHSEIFGDGPYPVD
ncbi:MAG: NAD(P)-dependent oxidoreductase [Pseudomonadota bacterium]